MVPTPLPPLTPVTKHLPDVPWGAHCTALPPRFLPHLLFAIPHCRVEVPVTVALRYGVAVCHERREGDSSNVWVLRDPLAPGKAPDQATAGRAVLILGHLAKVLRGGHTYADVR